MGTAGPAGPAGSVYGLLADGTTIEIRAATAADFDAVWQMHRAMSPDNIYLRFFSMSPAAGEQQAGRICRKPGPGHATRLAWLAGELVGVASYETGGRPGTAEVAVTVADHAHHRGVATLLLEHLVSAGRDQGIQTFTAEVLAENSALLRVFADAGLHARRASANGLVELAFDLPRDVADPGWEPYLDAVADREGRADAASLRHIFAPGSVAVIGASRNPRAVGRAILHNIVTGGYAGRVYPVNPLARELEGVPCLPSAAALPPSVDLAVVAVRPEAILGVAEDCGKRGVRSLVVITPGLDSPARADLLACCRHHGMRLIGPNCLGVAVPGIGLDATFGAGHPAAGKAGLAVQSGGVGIALGAQLSRLGIGVSSFASLGDKCDVSGNDLLMWWEQDPRTELAVLYLESFGNPRKFSRTARHAGATMPVLTVHAGRSTAGHHPAASPTAAAATSLITREALFEQAGIIATRDVGELIETAALLASQPVPRGGQLAIVSNAGGAGVLAAEACPDAGLHSAVLDRHVQDVLRWWLPAGADVTGPVDTTATVTPAAFRRCLEHVAADDGVDAILALVVPTAAGELVPAVCSAPLPKPAALVLLDQADAVRLLPSQENGPSTVPAYAYPRSAVRALGHAARYGAWRARAPGHVPEFADLRPDDARALIRGFLQGSPDGGWLSPAQIGNLLTCYGIKQITTRPASDEQATEAIIQPMITGGTEVILRVVQEPVFGPLVVFGLGGAATDVLGDRTARLTPLTDTDSAAMIHSIRAAPLLLGQGGTPAADLPALQDLLLRVARLADDLPQVAELDLDPVVADPGGAHIVDARVRLTPAQPNDAYLRRLR